MKVLLLCTLLAVSLLSTALAAPVVDYDVSIQELLKQLKRTKMAQTQRSRSYAREMQDYGGGGGAAKEQQQDYTWEMQYDDGGAEEEQEDYPAEEQQEYSWERITQQDFDNGDDTTDRDFQAAMQGWFDTLKNWGSSALDTARSGCNLVNGLGKRKKRDATGGTGGTGTGRAQFLNYLTSGANMVKEACKHIGGSQQATVEGLFGFTWQDLKNAATRAYNGAKKGCETYKSNAALRGGVKNLAGSKTKYLDMVCGGLGGRGGRPRQAAYQMILNHALRQTLEQARQERYQEKLGRAYFQTILLSN